MAQASPPNRVSARGLAAWQVELTLRLLLRDICAECPVELLAAACGLSRSYFSRAFKASMGESPHRWLLGRRVDRAVVLLDTTGESLSMIALACGFSDQSHFTRVFRASVGTSPAAWRRERKAAALLALHLPRSLEGDFRDGNRGIWTARHEGVRDSLSPATVRHGKTTTSD